MSSSIAESKSVTDRSCRSWRSRPSSSCLRSRSLLRRSLSMARCLAVAISHAPGLSGMPDSGHCSSAATSASCASSSARPTSRTMRASPAMILADSIRQTASMARCVSVAVTATDHIIFDLRLQVRQNGSETWLSGLAPGSARNPLRRVGEVRIPRCQPRAGNPSPVRSLPPSSWPAGWRTRLPIPWPP
jgi:hypothetical protein